ncbi:MAG: methyltransferase, partial [Zoogloeaceae bacterium]|nr:methyltransferase [Zoogloeaceae bacterium]
MTHRDLVDEMEATRHKLSKLNITDDMMDQMVDSVLREKEALSGRMKEMQAEYNAAMDAARAEIEANQGEKRPRALFLSATPFAYEKNIQWAKGYLFDWSDEQVMIGNSRQGGYEDFMVRHFGYRIRYHKLTEPGPEVDRGLLQREFNTWLRQQGALSARMLEVDHDYDRKFVLVESQIGRRIDEALEWLREGDNGLFYDLYRNVSDKFDYLTRTRLLQALKAQEILPYLQKQLELGRKAVVFYDFNQGGSIQVFALPEGSDHTVLTFEKKRDDSGKLRYSSVPKVDQRDPAGKPFKTEETDDELRITQRDYYARARKARPDIWEISTAAPNPRDTFRAAFGDVLAEYNGEVPTAQRNRLVTDFNDDRGGVKIIMAQKQANAGWSAHDTTGQHQRLLLNIGLPTAPVQSIQSEGRIYRVGQESDAMFRYVSIGTNWERFAFAERIARRAGTAENLAMGEDARALTESFVEAYEEAAWDEPGGENDGKGGKERDRALREAMTPFTKAKTYYFTQAKRTSKSKSYEGEDYYATPEPLGLKMVEWGLGKDGDEFLEPSAGHGAIARWFPPLAKRTVVEPSMELGSRLALATDAKLVTTSFEDFNIVNKADVIVMNPPFGRGGATAVRHLDKAVKHLRNGGRIVALIPEGPAADKAYDKWYEGVTGVYQRATYSLPRVTFERAGTSVKAKVVILDKYERPDIKDEQARAAAVMDQVGFERGRWDIDAADINEFFDQVEHLSAPERPELPKAADERPEVRAELPGAPERPEGLSISVDKETHTKTGADVWYGRINQKVDRDTYVLVKEVAVKHGGYWSRFKGGGAKPGFIFPDEAAARAFAAEVNQGPMASRGAVTSSPEFEAWFGDSKVVDQNGAPRVLYHGTAHSFGIFEGMVWGSVTPALANTYAEKEAYYRDDGMGHNVMPLYMRIEQPFDADVIRRGPVTVAEMFDAMLAQAGGKVPEKTLEKAAALQSTVKAGARIEESGPHYSAHDFWYDTRALFGKDGAAALSEAFRLLGFDGVKFTERGNLTYGAFLPGQVKSATGNAGTFGRAVDDIRMSSGSTTAGAVTATDINKVIDQQMKGMAARIQVHAVDRQADLPAFVLSMMKPGERPHGLYYMGHAWLIGENIASKRDVATHLAHEVFGHLAPEAVIDNWPEVEAFINRLVADGNPRAVSISNEVVRRYPDYAKGSPEYVREFIALTAERTRNGPLAKLMSMLRAALRRFLTSLGVKRFMEDAELDVILRNGEVFLRTDGAKSTRAPSPQQMASQRKDQQAVWFSALHRAVMDAPQDKATPEQWRAWMKKAGVKEEEINWLGVDDFLAAKKTVTKDEVEAFVREGTQRAHESIPDLVDRGSTLFSRRDDARTILDYLRELAKHLDTFQLPRSDSKDFAEVVKAMRPSWTVKKGYFGDDNVYEIITENATALVFTANDRAGIKPGDNLVWVNVAEMREGQAGAVVYQAVATWAYNTGRVFIGDPDGLTDKAVVRRTEHMLSSALRHGTTRHLRPAAEQAMPWKAGDDLGNMLALVEYSMRNMRQRYPSTKNLVYNFSTGEVVNTKSGRIYDTVALEALGKRYRGVGVRARRATLARAALYNGILQRAGSPEGVGLLADAALQRSGADRAPRAGRPILEGVLYSRGERAPGGAGLDTLREQTPLFEGGFDIPSETLKDVVIRAIQDRMRRVKILERSIAEAGGDVSEQTSPYLGEELYHGRVAEALNDFQHDYVEPLLEAMGVEGVSMDDLDRYLYARHAKERNAHIAEIRPDMPDGGSGMTNAEADQVLASFGDRADVMENMAVKVDAINQARLDLLERESLEHPDQIALWRDRWQHYV